MSSQILMFAQIGPEAFGALTLSHYLITSGVLFLVFGTLLAKVDASGDLDMRYQHISVDGNFKSGRCHSRPESLADGRLRLHERWQWTDGAEGNGVSIIEEVSRQ